MDGTDLAGRTAVVTGASRGIGREIAARLAGAGVRVVAIARAGDGPAWCARRRHLPRPLPHRHGWAGRARSVEEGADTAVWLAGRPGSLSDPPPTGRLWEDRVEVPW